MTFFRHTNQTPIRVGKPHHWQRRHVLGQVKGCGSSVRDHWPRGDAEQVWEQTQFYFMGFFLRKTTSLSSRSVDSNDTQQPMCEFQVGYPLLKIGINQDSTKCFTSSVSPKFLHSLACTRLLRSLVCKQVHSKVISGQKA